jgi:hypothetical protein
MVYSCGIHLVRPRLIAAVLNILIAAIFILLAAAPAPADENPGNSKTPQDKSGTSVFRHVGLGLEGRVFSGNHAYYKMLTGRIIDINIFSVNRIFFSMYINEFVCYDDIEDNIEPKSINYEMDYLRMNVAYSYGILSLFLDHNCSNIYNEMHTEDRQARWYGYGITWESYGFRTGMKNVKSQGTGYPLLDNLKYKLSAGKKIHTRVLNYDYMATGVFRYDLLFFNYFIPYIEGSFNSIIDSRIRFNRYFEAGFRLPFEKGDLSLFAGANHKHDIEYYNTSAVDWYYIGLRGEALVGTGDTDKGAAKPGTGKLPGFPDFHLSGTYGKFIADDNLNFNTDIIMGLDWLSEHRTSPFIDTSLVHSSYKQSTGMFPRYMKSNVTAGIAHRIDFIDAFIDAFYGYTRYDSGNYDSGYVEKFSSVGLKLGSRGMKKGYASHGFDFDAPENFKWINRFDWMVSGSKALKGNHHDFDMEYNAGIRWNLFRYYRSVPYITCGAGFFKNDGYESVYNIEPGIRFRHGIDWMLFYRYEHRTEVHEEKGYFRDYHLAGVRLEI